jgi:hypothetical protein
LCTFTPFSDLTDSLGATDERDSFMTQLEQMVHREAPAELVIDGN